MYFKKLFFIIIIWNISAYAQKFIISGGPCVGKSTTIEALKSKNFQTVSEVFSEKYFQAKKQNTLDDFFKNPEKLNAYLADEIILRKNKLDASEPSFLDRSALEVIFFSNFQNTPLSQKIIEKIKKQQYQSIVFILDPLPKNFYENTEIRSETRESALHQHEQLKIFYREYGFTLINVPFSTPEERVEFILKKVLLWQK